MRDSEFVSVAEAQEIIGVSRPIMAKMLKDGRLTWERSPVDGRVKLIKRVDVDRLVAMSVRKGNKKRAKTTAKRSAPVRDITAPNQ